MGNTFGDLFKITTWGESHGPSVGVVVDGCIPGLTLTHGDIQEELDRRRPGQSKVTTSRDEKDTVRILSGVFEDKTLGTPISMIIDNKQSQSKDYEVLKNVYRPSHADYTYHQKYGIYDYRGGGRSSARETVARVAAGAIAKKILSQKAKIQISAYVERVGNIVVDESRIDDTYTEQSIMRCPDPIASEQMVELVRLVQAEGDSLGGAIVCKIVGVLPGLGEPVFDKLEADLAKAMLSIPAVKAFEIGSGFAGTYKKASEQNDLWTHHAGAIRTQTNHSGGIQGGISNGEMIYFRVGLKAPSSILKSQETVDKEGNAIKLSIGGRHDPCVLPRAVCVVEAMARLVLVNHWLRQHTLEIID